MRKPGPLFFVKFAHIVPVCNCNTIYSGIYMFQNSLKYTVPILQCFTILLTMSADLLRKWRAEERHLGRWDRLTASHPLYDHNPNTSLSDAKYWNLKATMCPKNRGNQWFLFVGYKVSPEIQSQLQGAFYLGVGTASVPADPRWAEGWAGRPLASDLFLSTDLYFPMCKVLFL